MHIRGWIIGTTVLSGLSFVAWTYAKTTSADEAETLVASLTEAERTKLILPFDAESRESFAYTPGVRAGLSLKELDEGKRQAVLGLVRSALSETGYRKVDEIRTQLEPVLKELERGNPGRNLELYYLTFFGRPGKDRNWSWRYEGHHVSLNFTYRSGTLVATTPQFLGSNPAEVPEGPLKGKRVLAKEEDLGRALLMSLSEDQKKRAILSDRAPSDLLTSNQTIASIEGHLGLGWEDMAPEQRRKLRELVEEYANVQRPDQAKARLEKIEKSGWSKLRFAWMGGSERGQGHYYRVQGPTFLIEYDNTQNRANHIHTVWRDFKGDWGRDALAEHYRTSGHHQPR